MGSSGSVITVVPSAFYHAVLVRAPIDTERTVSAGGLLLRRQGLRHIRCFRLRYQVRFVIPISVHLVDFGLRCETGLMIEAVENAGEER